MGTMPAEGRTTEITLQHRVVVSEHVVAREFGDETVILDVQSGEYHGLNRTAGLMFEALRDAPSIGRAAESLAGLYRRRPSVSRPTS